MAALLSIYPFFDAQKIAGNCLPLELERLADPVDDKDASVRKNGRGCRFGYRAEIFNESSYCRANPPVILSKHCFRNLVCPLSELLMSPVPGKRRAQPALRRGDEQARQTPGQRQTE